MYDVIVIGGGHAGVEAAAAACRVGARTAMVTLHRSALARLSCNPAMGGAAKGQLIREIDALGGVMPIATDRAAIQYLMLNRSKGPAVWSPRAQVDRETYTREIDSLVAERYPQLEILEDEVVGLETKGGRLQAVITAGRTSPLRTRTAVICSGTFLRGLVHLGDRNWPSGRYTEDACNRLSESLKRLGYPLRRFKTGTPPRVVRETIDLDRLELQEGDRESWFFADETTSYHLPQRSCWRVYTNEATHRMLRENIHLSPLYNGTITSIGPRYCPSIEDKVMRFPGRDRHPLVLEPEGLDHPWLYLNGFSSSLPEDVQLAALRTLPGCGGAEIGRPGYAIEYDVVPSAELRSTLESRRVHGLYFAGQVSGTSGYEEAGALGLVAGANAARGVLRREPFRLKRSEAYVGVLVDDLVTLDPDEPYRMFTSRAEYRLYLRQDNAEERLGEKAYSAGLITRERIERIREKLALKRSWIDRLKRIHLPRKLVIDNDHEPERVESAAHLLKRPGVGIDHLLARLDGTLSDSLECRRDILKAVETDVVYEGYIARQQREIDRLREQENTILPESLEYEELPGLSAEARHRLQRHRPETLGQASRLAGVTPSDLAILLVYTRKTRNKKAHDEQ